MLEPSGLSMEGRVTICRRDSSGIFLKASKEPSAMKKLELVRFEIEGAEMAVRLAGDREKPALPCYSPRGREPCRRSIVPR